MSDIDNELAETFEIDEEYESCMVSYRQNTDNPVLNRIIMISCTA